MPLGFPIQQSEQTLTAARPSRILTVFPFDYPKAQLQNLQSGYILFKEQKNAITLSGNGQTKKRKILLIILGISAVQWRKEIADGLPDSEFGWLRFNTHTGRPLGSDSFLSKLEKLLGRRVRPLPVGRPKEQKRVKSKRKIIIEK